MNRKFDIAQNFAVATADRGSVKGLTGTGLLLAFVFLTGCTAFEPPRFDGNVAKIEEPIELPFDPVGDFSFSENSTIKVSRRFSLGRLGSMYGNSEVRTSAAAYVSVKPAGDGFVMSLNFSRIKVKPVGQGGRWVEGGFMVENLVYTGFMNHEGRLIEFDVDKNSLGWLALNMEIKQSVEAELTNWKNRRDREPVLPRIITGGETIEVDAGAFAPERDGKPPADYKLTGKTVFQFAGLTQYRNQPHLLLNFDGNLQGGSRVGHVDLDGDIGGYVLISVDNGRPSYWKHSVRVRAIKSWLTVTIREETEGELNPR